MRGGARRGRRGRLQWEKEGKDERKGGGGGEEGTLASPGMPADHERCRYDGFTFYSLPTGRFTPTASLTSTRYASPYPPCPAPSPVLPRSGAFTVSKNESLPRSNARNPMVYMYILRLI